MTKEKHNAISAIAYTLPYTDIWRSSTKHPMIEKMLLSTRAKAIPIKTPGGNKR